MKSTIPTNILIVDDEEIFRGAVAEVLELSGYSVKVAANGQEATDILRKHRIDLMLLDLNMPVMNGWHTFRQVVSLSPMLPVVIVTARSNLREMVLDCGADALLEKPVDMDELLTLVDLLTSPMEKDKPSRKRRTERRSRFIRESFTSRDESALND